MASLSPLKKTPSSSSLRTVGSDRKAPVPLPPPRPVTAAPQSCENDTEPPSTALSAPSSPAKPPHLSEDMRRDSGLAPSNFTSRDNRPKPPHDDVASLKKPPSIPNIVVDQDTARPSSRRSEKIWNSLRGRKSEEAKRPAVPPLRVPNEPFRGIMLDIPTGSFEDLTMDTMRFSNRGSMLNGAQNTLDVNTSPVTSPARSNARRVKSANSLRVRPSSSATRALSVDEEILSQRVRLMYDKGNEDVSDTEVNEMLGLENNGSVLWEESVTGDDANTASNMNADSATDITNRPPSAAVSQSSKREASAQRDKDELAGGIEDWQDVQAGDVDRYGFIIPRKDEESEGSVPQPVQRVSTSLMLASTSPRRKRTMRRAPSIAGSSKSFTGPSPTRKSSELSNRPTSSQSSYQASIGRSSSRLRYATNRLPHNKNRKFVDEAADMLTLPEHAGDDDKADTPYARMVRKKEWEREDKWQKMAKLTSKNKDGSGMVFEFDVKSSKLIERTWKGIPDRWRATAWHAFLSASAKKRKDCLTDQELIEKYNELQLESSPDDVQIDIDVPRTISSHIMFRRRYRGGQRLLFRVLHAMSLYFPDTGYVQGMAALAATLLAYYDEEHAFIMLVRLWQLRGLDRLYRSGFSGLMEALDNFEKEWLDGGEVAEKLVRALQTMILCERYVLVSANNNKLQNELGIPPTAYGTRWYLTLFNYSIPFPAQLRVWDVFMLLGDSGEPAPSRPPSNAHNANGIATTVSFQPSSNAFGKSLDVLHATSAALIDGMRDIILESDFENAMKVLTSWVPVKDIEIFMRVARAEWKVHSRKKA